MSPDQNKRKVELLKTIHQALEQGTLTENNPALQEFIKEYNSPTAYLFLGDAANKREQYKKAYDYYKRAEEILTPASFVREDRELIHVLIKHNLTNAAINHYATNPDKPNSIQPVQELVERGFKDSLLYFALGENAFVNDNYATAHTWLTKALSKDLVLEERVADAHVLRGISALHMNKLDEGEQELKTIIEQNPAVAPFARQFLIDFYEAHGNYSKVIEYQSEQDFTKPQEECDQ